MQNRVRMEFTAQKQGRRFACGLAALIVFGSIAETAFGITRHVSRSGNYEDQSIWQDGEMPSVDGADTASIGAIRSAAAGSMIPASADVTFNDDLT